MNVTADAERELRRQPLVGAWLLSICALVVAMILVGGATRLTDSGLSITEWDLAKGLTPPLSAARWAEEFALYQQTTEYRIQNQGMSLDAFKTIYWWEWGHRFLGKVIGIVFALPFLFFLATGRLRGRFWPVLALFALGGLQGAIGWWMVTSGLWSGLDVSPLRLAVHLGMAFAILGAALWLALDALGWPRIPGQLAISPWPIAGFIGLLFAQIVFGAILAGADGGRAYADWPTIGGVWWPQGAFEGALAQNHATQHILHRTLGYVVALAALWLAWAGLRTSSSAPARTAALAMGLVAMAQMALGIVTVVHAAPMSLGLLHQAGAIVLWISAISMFRVTVK